MNSIEYYTSISNMPISRFVEIQKLYMIETGIGSNITDFDNHFKNLTDFIKIGDEKKAFNEINNLRMLFNNINEKRNTSHYIFTKFIKSIKKKALKMKMRCLNILTKKD